MAGKVKVKLNHAALQDILDGEAMTRELWARGQRVLERAKDTAPVLTGEYKSKLRLEEAHTDRAVVRVAGYAHHTLVVEARTGNLARALDAARGE